MIFQPFDAVGLRSNRIRRHIIHVIENDIQFSRRRNLRIQIAQRSRRSVPRILQGFGRFGIIFLKYGAAHYALAFHLRRPVERNAGRNRTNCHHLRGNILADDAVTARCRARKQTVFVSYDNGQSVKFVFESVLRVSYGLFDFCVPFAQFFETLALIQRIQPAEMSVLRERFDGFSAHLSRGRIVKPDARFFFERDEFVIQSVVHVIRDARIVEDVIPVRIFVKQSDKLFHSVFLRFRHIFSMGANASDKVIFPTLSKFITR